MPDQAKFMRQIGEPWATGDVDVVDDLVPADIAYHLAGFPDMDRAALKQFMAAFHQSFPNFSLTIEEDLVDGDRSVHRWTCSATFTGEGGLVPVPPTCQATTASGAHVVHWRGEDPVEIWHFGDWLGWLQGAGVIPALG
jgi:predicted ester cyclase